MSVPSGTPLNVEVAPGKPPMLTVPAGTDPGSWARDQSDLVRAAVTDHGSLLVRGLGLADPAVTGDVFRALARELMTEVEAFAPRDELPGGVYSSTTWPANQQMCMHHELSYTHRAPGLMMFACLQAPAAQGATTVADATEVLAALPSDLVSRFESQGWMLLRTYNDEIGASVADSFGTADRAQVDAYCAANGIETQWQPDGGLRTRQRRPAVITHPVTGARCWFNQVAFLSEYTLDPEVREFLLDMYGPDGLPFTTAYGDGAPLGEDVVDLLNEVYTAHTRREPWQDGDLLLVDNVRTAHAREPYQGPRRVLVALADPITPTATTDLSGGIR